MTSVLKMLPHLVCIGLALTATPVAAQDAGSDATTDAGEDVPDAKSCYSPTQNAEKAYDQGAVGCSCDDAVDQDVCVSGAALVCENGRWQAVIDGPCLPEVHPEPASLCSAGQANPTDASGAALMWIAALTAAVRLRARSTGRK
jgi:hypothetical protein